MDGKGGGVKRRKSGGNNKRGQHENGTVTKRSRTPNISRFFSKNQPRTPKTPDDPNYHSRRRSQTPKQTGNPSTSRELEWKPPVAKDNRQIGGVEVPFPEKPYGCQIFMMHTIVKGLQQKKNCLIESPTGTGKTLSLLCSTLAWLRKEKELIKAEYELELSNLVREQMKAVNQDPKVQEESTIVEPLEPTKMDVDDPDWEPLPSFSNVEEVLPEPSPVEKEETKSKPNQEKTLKKRRSPRIFYGTRTHKQLAQVMAELRRITFQDMKHTILSSREHTCVNEDVRADQNVNVACHKLLDEEGCVFNSRLKSKFDKPEELRKAPGLLNNVWDIEDLVDSGRRNRYCSYFAATRVLSQDADIIMCPYNYLIDPIIRDSMELSLVDNVVILDEAHNIEDSCREATSFLLTDAEFTEASDAFHDFLKSPMSSKTPRLKSIYSLFKDCGDKVLRWMKEFEEKNELKVTENETLSDALSGADMQVQLVELGVTQENSSMLEKGIAAVSGKSADDDLQKELQKDDIFSFPPRSCLKPVEKLAFLGKFMFYHKDSIGDYKMVVRKKMVYEENQAKRKNRESGLNLKEIIEVHFWCMNPGLAFTDAFAKTRSVIVTSGTLCPKDTFASELCTEFPFQVEANHVVPNENVFATFLTAGPSRPMRCTYGNYNQFEFQDELGRMVRSVCTTLPGGILIFLPSYYLMEKLYNRWEETGELELMKQSKLVLTEPRRGNLSNKVMEQFESEIQRTQESTTGQTGSLLMAVFRGKFSEGMDFADDNARAVISVGIPFPNCKNLEVGLKMKYNDEHREKGLLPGSSWYEIQAFRALNQGLGRCLRHKQDWGALIIVDQRFGESFFSHKDQRQISRYQEGISKWIRVQSQVCSDFSQFVQGLQEFSNRHSQRASASEIVIE